MTTANSTVDSEAAEADRPRQKPMVTFGPYATGSGFVEVSVWKNTHQGQNGERTVYTVSFHRSYKDDADQWQKSQSLFTSDIPALILGLNKAYEFILSRKQQEKK
jgi:hypothetical protein